MSTVIGENIVTNGLVLHLDAADNKSYAGTGSNWINLINNTNAGITGSFTYSNINYGAIQLNNANSYANGTTILSKTFSYNIWFKRSEINREQHLIEYVNTQFYVATNNKLGVAAWIAATALAGTTSLDNTTIYNATLTRDGNGTSIYLNGVLESTTTSKGADPVSGSYYIGQYYSLGPYWFNGYIFSCQIYNKVLSSTEVLQNYNALSSRFDTTKTVSTTVINPVINPNTIVTDNLILLLDAADYMSYPGSGLTWSDLSSSNIKASIGASFSYLTTYSGALSFDGTSSNSKITIPNSTITQFATASSWAVSIAFSTSSLTQSQPYPSIFGKGNAASTASNSGIVLYFYRSGTKDIFAVKTNNINDTFFNKNIGTNMIMTVTYDTQYYRLYVNGKYYKISSAYQLGVDTTNPLYIGYTDYLSAINVYSFLKYSKNLTSFEVLQNYNIIRSRLGLNTIVNDIINVYTDRVTTAGGTIEATDNTYNYLSNFDSKNLFVDATWVNIPGAYKSGSAYSQFPNYQVSGGNYSDIIYSRSTSGTRVNSSNVIETISLNVPRIDYSQGVPCLLTEPQRRNLILYSSQFDQLSWQSVRLNAFGSGSVVNYAIGPDGALSAYLIQEQTGQTSYGGVGQTVTLGTASNYIFSTFAKKVDNDYIVLIDSSSIVRRTWFNISSGTIGILDPGHTASIQQYPNGWYRCIISFAASASITTFYTFQDSGNGSFIAPSNSATLLWGAQLEDRAIGSVYYPTSYIPTTSAAVTRSGSIFNIDNIYTTGLIGTQSGSWFIDLRNNLVLTRDTSGTGMHMRYSSGNINGISIRKGPDITKRLSIEICSDGVNFVAIYYTTATASKLAITWGATAMNIYENGIKVITNQGFTQSGMQQLYSDIKDIPRYIAGMALWDYQLTDSQSIALTS